MFLKNTRINFIFFLLFFIISNSIKAFDYEASKAQVKPVIDGADSDDLWATAIWYNMNQTWIGNPPTVKDFSGRFKLGWDESKLYLLAEITDDVFNDHHSNPLTNYYDDDALEILLDEDKSGGEHEKSYNAFAYHISTLLDVVDVDISGNAKVMKDNVSSKWTKNGNVYTWECAINVYTDKFILGALSNPLAEMVVGKKLGFSLAYCDNDGGESRQNFMGSDEVNLSDKNVAYKVADYFGTVTLVDKPAPPAVSFSHNLIASGLANPTVMVCAEDGRIFVCEQEGNLRIIKNDILLESPVLTVNTTKVGFYSERGLIGFALDPDFGINNYIYVYYTSTENTVHNRVSRFTLNGDFVLPGSEKVLLDLDPLGASLSHNGGAMAFGKDGKLYIATGDNQIAVEPRVSQDLTNTYGKLLRINSDGTIPSDNPFDTGAGRSNLVWSYGLRNPFTFDVHPETGKIFLNDVGEIGFEEINDATLPGKNFGWPFAEGFSTIPEFSNPVYTYNHSLFPSDSLGCAITGGVFFKPLNSNYPKKYTDCYFFMDFCNNWINYIDVNNGNKRFNFEKTLGGSVAIDLGIDGNLYYLSRTTSSVYKIVASDNPFPVISNQPDSTYTYGSQPTTFSVSVTGKGPFSYQWTKDGINIAGATNNSYVISKTSTADAGTYSVLVSNAIGSVTSMPAFLTVGPENAKPQALILSPTLQDQYIGGGVINFSGSGSDKEDGVLSSNSFTWYINFHHDNHVHDGTPVAGLESGSFTIPSSGETSDNVFFRIILIVKDKNGLSDSAIVDIFPKKSKLTFLTQPSGLQIKLDGQPKTAPFNTMSVQGVTRSIGPVMFQSYNGKTYEFDYWLPSGATDQNFSTPVNDATYTAVYKPVKKDTVIIAVREDAYVQDGSQNASDATTAFGSTNKGELISKTYEFGPNRNIFLKFNMEDFKDSIVSADFEIFGNIETGSTIANSIPIAIFSSSDTTWNEETITWNTKPLFNSTKLDTIKISGTTGKYYKVNVTDLLRQARMAGNKYCNLILVATQSNQPRVIFHSKENVSGKVPRLVFTSDSLITVKVSSFSGEAAGEIVTLKWQAANEIKNKEFVILRTLDKNSAAEEIGIVSSKNSGLLNDYTFTDISPKAGLNYYTLKVVDKEGYFRYSNTIEILSSATGIESKIVNDETLQFYVNRAKANGTQLKIKLNDLLGREWIIVGDNEIKKLLNSPAFQAGIYILSIWDDNTIIYKQKLFNSAN